MSGRRKTRVMALALGISMVVNISGNTLCTFAQSSSDYHTVSDIVYHEKEMAVLKIANKERMAKGLEPLMFIGDLQKAAHLRAEELETLFSHTRPDGSSCFTVFNSYQFALTSCGENVAAGQTSAAQVMSAWMESEGHRKNILNAFQYMGVGYVEGGAIYKPSWVQLFIDSKDQCSDFHVAGTENLTIKQGQRLEDAALIAQMVSDVNGLAMLPVIDEMCSNFDSAVLGTQTVTVQANGLQTTFDITVVQDSASSSPAVGSSSSRSVSAGNLIPGSEYVTRGKWIKDRAGWKFRKMNGAYASSEWVMDDGTWYIIGAEGIMLTGWQTINSKWYYFDASGKMLAAADTPDGFYVNESGEWVPEP